VHAAKVVNGETFGYDANGNMTWRLLDGAAYEQVWDAENRLAQVKKGATVQAAFVYDGDGARVKATVAGVTTAYVGSHFEWAGSTTTMKVYYYAGGERVAMRVGSSAVYWLLGDHLGSTSVTVASNGVRVAELRYKAWGETRYASGTTPTSYRFTGQQLESNLGLYLMGARWYDPQLARWLSADTLVPDPATPQALNRYSFVVGNPLRFTDPSGHGACSGDDYDPACTEDFFPALDTLFDEQWLQWLFSWYAAKAALVESYLLPIIWLGELGDDVQSLGPRDPLTWEISNDPGVAEFMQMWAQEGYADRFAWKHTIDERDEDIPLLRRRAAGALVYARENAEMALASTFLYPATVESRVDSVGGILGSLDKISAMEVAPGVAKITVENEMGWASFTRKPGTDESFVENVRRAVPGVGGTVTFRFYWFVRIP